MISVAEKLISTSGLLELSKERGFGFLRSVDAITENDAYISPSQIKRFDLREGDLVVGQARPPKDNEQAYSMMKILEINGSPPDTTVIRTNFNALTPIHPNRKITLETTNIIEIENRIIDLFTPIGFGQRGLIVAPPKAGKTTLLKSIANGITHNHPQTELLILLIDERPEEVIDIKRSIPTAKVFSSTFDERPQNHIKVTELVLALAKRLVENKQDVIILMDSITRLSRAYNVTTSSSGRTMSGGFDPSAFYGPKKFFGAARNTEEGGSLTILATALIGTGSKMDEVIFEEFKGTGNMELHLDRKLAERRIYPAIDILRSGTRKEELLFSQEHLNIIWNIRRKESDPTDLLYKLIRLFKGNPSNEHVLRHLSNK
ncbi:transcription termination factor Rho [Bacillaceae bacterium IKA-2]|nr:transcription termination factor Rho [Bacillaceae bacterium IKA-2]